jgi:tetratricopeptide (TPR) repeat protein
MLLREVSHLLAFTKEFDRYKKNCNMLLLELPKRRDSWVSFITSLLLTGEYEEAIKAIDSYVQTMPKENLTPQELCELLYLKIDVLWRLGRLKEALECLESGKEEKVNEIDTEIKNKTRKIYEKEYEKKEHARKERLEKGLAAPEVANEIPDYPNVIGGKSYLRDLLDTPMWLLWKGKILLRQRDFSRAAVCFEDLIDYNSENYSYHRGYRLAHKIDGVGVGKMSFIIVIILLVLTVV